MARPNIKKMRLKRKAYNKRKILRAKTETIAQRAMRLAEARGINIKGKSLSQVLHKMGLLHRDAIHIVARQVAREQLLKGNRIGKAIAVAKAKELLKPFYGEYTPLKPSSPRAERRLAAKKEKENLDFLRKIFGSGKRRSGGPLDGI